MDIFMGGDARFEPEEKGFHSSIYLQ